MQTYGMEKGLFIKITQTETELHNYTITQTELYIGFFNCSFQVKIKNSLSKNYMFENWIPQRRALTLHYFYNGECYI